MAFEVNGLPYIPKKPFDSYKWIWAAKTPTESLNDPVILLGVLSRMKKLEGTGLKYSSPEFAQELARLEDDIAGSVSVNLSGRGGSRNLIRNSGQYWKSLGLIPRNSHGIIELTMFGRLVASGAINQSTFAALIVQVLSLPNPNIYSYEEVRLWEAAGIKIYPLRLILMIMKELGLSGTASLSTNELAHIIVPMAGDSNWELRDYAEAVLEYRKDPTQFSNWPDCTPDSNDRRMLREFLIFLANYGFVRESRYNESRFDDQYIYNDDLDDQISEMLSHDVKDETVLSVFDEEYTERIASEMDNKRLAARELRPGQANFRKAILGTYERCVITNATMPEILEAAHIKPHKYGGPEAVDNGFAMRTDIHRLFDTNHLRINPNGLVELSERARYDYGSMIPPSIVLPDSVNREYLRWRYDNYYGL